jgi:hypothetical protein
MTKKQKNKTSKSKSYLQTNRSVIILLGIIIFSFGFLLFAGIRTDRSRTNIPKEPSKNPEVVNPENLPKKVENTSQSSNVQNANNATIASTDTKEKNTHASEILKQKDYPQYRYEALATVNDPQVGSSWYHGTVQSGRGWDVSTGSSSTVIAVIDSGFALSHEDLANKWVLNSGEQGTTAPGDICHSTNPGDKTLNNCDDDQNGYEDDWRGWDFSSSDNSPQTGEVNSAGYGTQHGTLVSGIIAATANNSKGNAGIDQQAKIMPLQALSDDGDGYTYDIVSAIEYAVNNGAHIINLSLGGNQFDQAFLNAVVYAKEQGVLVVAASGNCGDSSTDICAGLTAPGRETYPAKFSEVLSVGATTSGDVRSSFSSYGPRLDIVAPGSSIGPLASWSSTYTTNGYVSSADGTSFSAPIVAAIAGLVRSQMGPVTVDRLASILTDSTDKIGDLTVQNRSDTYGFGRVNAHKATLLAKSIVTPPGTVGTTAIEARQPARGGITRSVSGNVAADEWSVIACRVEASDACSAVVTNGANVLRIDPIDKTKGASLYYMFVKGSSIASGTSTISVHNRNYATSVGTLTK